MLLTDGDTFHHKQTTVLGSTDIHVYTGLPCLEALSTTPKHLLVKSVTRLFYFLSKEFRKMLIFAPVKVSNSI